MNGTGMVRCLLSHFILIIWFSVLGRGEKISEKSMATGDDISLCLCVCVCSSAIARLESYIFKIFINWSLCMCSRENHCYVHHQSLLHFGIVGVWRCELQTNNAHFSGNEPWKTIELMISSMLLSGDWIILRRFGHILLIHFNNNSKNKVTNKTNIK